MRELWYTEGGLQDINGSMPPSGTVSPFSGGVWPLGKASPTCRLSGRHFALADGALLAQLGAAADLARLLVMFTLAELLGKAAAFEQLLEAAQGRPDGFPVVNAHPKGHSFSL